MLGFSALSESALSELPGSGAGGNNTVFALAVFRDIAGAGGAALSLHTYRVTFWGDAVPEDLAAGEQLKVEVRLPHNFTNFYLRTVLVADIQNLAIEHGLTILPSDIRSTSWDVA